MELMKGLYSLKLMKGSYTHPFSINERVHLLHSDDVGHEGAKPLGVQEVEFTELALHIIVV